MCSVLRLARSLVIGSYLKFILDLAGVGLRVQPADVVVERAELTHRYSCVATEASFQDGIMYKHILLLQGRGELRGLNKDGARRLMIPFTLSVKDRHISES